MPQRGIDSEPPNAVELDIIRSFGWSLIELEEILYERFLHLSSARSLIPRDIFQSHLRDMEAKGFIIQIPLHGMKGYKRLLADRDLGKSLRPTEPLDEIRLALGSMKAKPIVEKKRESVRTTPDVLSRSEEVGRAIQGALENWMLREHGRISKGAVHEHMKNMCQALSKSEEALFEYIRLQTPGILIEVGRILRAQGTDFLLLSLRLTEANMRKYSY